MKIYHVCKKCKSELLMRENIPMKVSAFPVYMGVCRYCDSEQFVDLFTITDLSDEMNL